MTLECEDLRAVLAEPGVYCRGTRFDWSGVMEDLSCGRCRYVDTWFDNYDPFRHDCICGPAEEFTQSGYESAGIGGRFLKIGVGLLEKDSNEPYDRFHLYRIADGGKWTWEASEGGIVYSHHLPGYYSYSKRIQLLPGRRLRIGHRLANEGQEPLEGHCYCHNFFTLGGMNPGPDVRIRFPFPPAGEWRKDSVKARLCEHGIQFTGALAKGEKSFMGNLVSADGRNSLEFDICNLKTGLGVECSCPLPFEYMVFFANDRIACLEPYIHYRVLPGEYFDWDLNYRLYRQE